MALPLHVTTLGEPPPPAVAPPLLVVHGLFGQGGNWGGVARRLAATRRVMLVDLRNHGESPHDPRMDYPAMADDLAGLAREAGGNVDVLGHSMGGKAAMLLALTEPRLVARLVIVDVAPVAYQPVFRAYAEAMAALPLRPGLARADADAALREAVPNPAERAFLLQNLKLGGEHAAWRLNLPAIIAAMDTISGFPALPDDVRWDGEALFVSGERSAYVDADGRRAALSRFPRAAFAVVPGAGHWVQAEAPEAFLGVVEPFLARQA